MWGSRSAEAAAGDLAERFRYGFVTGHRPENSPNGSFLIAPAAAPDPEESLKNLKPPVEFATR